MPKVIDGITYYTVRFLNYAGDDLLGTCDVEAGGDATPFAPEPEVIEGMTFVGWNVPITNVVEDMTVRPVYTGAVETFTVRFLNKDATDVLSVQEVERGGDAVVPVPPKEDGFIFIGWSSSFVNVTEDKTIYSRYRIIPPNPVLNFYHRNADNTAGSHIISYSGVNACTISQKLTGECTIDFKLLTRQMEGIVSVKDVLELEGLVFSVTEIQKNISGGMCYTQMKGEHISYILNDDEYLVTAFDMSGTPQSLLSVLLSGTPFTIGTVDMEQEVTLRVNKEATRRAVIMQLVALVKGEIEYYGYTIGIRSHQGRTEPVDIMKTENVQDISYSYNATEQRYSFSLSLYQKKDVELGDELHIKFKPLGIDTQRRVVGFEWNPFNYKEVGITVGAYIPTLNDSLYELINEVQDIREASAKYTVEFGELIGNGTFYFTRAYNDRPYFHIHTSDGSNAAVTLNRKDGSAFGSYVGATLSGVGSRTVTLLVFYCTVPDISKEEEDGV